MKVAFLILVALLVPAAPAGPRAVITIHPDQALGMIDPRIFGEFTEATLTSYEGGVLSEMLFNRKFEIPEDGRGTSAFDSFGLASGWQPVQFDSSVSFLVDRRNYYSPSQSQRITKVAGSNIPAGIEQTGYRYVPPQISTQQRVDDPFDFKPGKTYRVRLAIKNRDLRGKVTVALGESWKTPGVKHEFIVRNGKGWGLYRCDLTPSDEIRNGKFMIYFDLPGTIWVDSVSMVRTDLDEDGFRRDVLDLTRQAKPTSIRWPGGWFVSDYDWRDGIGPVDQRPSRLNRSWLGYWDNDIGIDEFVKLCRKLHVQPYVSVNVGTGTAEEAAALVEYANGSRESRWGRVRAKNGHPEPYGIRDWGIGNEEYLQTLGGVPGPAYGEKSIDFAKAMRAVDPSIHLSAVGVLDLEGGPSASQHPYYRYVRFIFDWNRQVLPLSGQVMDYYSIHHYDPNDSVAGMTTHEINEAAMLSAEDLSTKLDHLHEQMAKYAPRGKNFPIALDEWAVWLPHEPSSDGKPPTPEEAKAQPLLGLKGSLSTLRDALAEAAVYNLMQRRPNDFSVAHHTFLYVYGGGVVGIGREHAAIASSGLLLQLFSTYERTLSVRTEVQGPTFAFSKRPGIAGDYSGADHANYLDVSARLRPDGKTLEIFVLNRSLDDDIDTDLRVAGQPLTGLVSVAVLNAKALTDWNSFDEPDRVAITRSQVEMGKDGTTTQRFPAHSLSLMSLEIQPETPATSILEKH